MNSVIAQIEALKGSLYGMKTIFKKYKGIDTLEVDYSSDCDDGDMVFRPTVLRVNSINRAIGGGFDEVEDIEPELAKLLEGNCYTMFIDTDGEIETLSFNRGEILKYE